MTTSIQTMQSNEFLRQSTSPLVRPPPHLLPGDLQSQLNMLYALTQQSLPNGPNTSSPSDLTLESKLKRFKKTMPLPNEPPSQVPYHSATESRSSSTSEREMVKVVTTAGPQTVDKEFLSQLLSRKDVIPARKRRDFIPNEMKDDHYWERRRKNNLAAKRSREKRRLNDIVLETKVVELTNENEALKAKLNLMLSRLNMKETEMESLFEEEQRLGHISLKPATSAATIFAHRSGTSDEDDDIHPPTQVARPPLPVLTEKSDINDDEHVSTTIDDPNNARTQHPLLYNQLIGNNNNNNGAMDLSRNEMKVGNLLTTAPEKSPSPLTPSPSPPNESLLQILANQILKTKQQETVSSTTPARLLTIASPPESKSKRPFNQIHEETEQHEQDQQQRKWNEAAMTLLSLNKPTPPAPVVEQQKALQSVCQSVINGLLRKPSVPRATIDYHSQQSLHHQMQGENFHQQSLAQLKTLMNYFSNASNNSFGMPPSNTTSSTVLSDATHISSQPTAPVPAATPEPRGDMMPLKLRMKMLNAKN